MLRKAKYAKNHFQQNRHCVFESHGMRKETVSTKILRTNGNSEVVQGTIRWTATRTAYGPRPPRFCFLSAYHTEVDVAILLKIIFRVISFSSFCY